MLNLYQLSIFLAVVETQSFSAAAQKLHLTQPAVSQQMRAMEKNLGLSLFARDGQRVGPTRDALNMLPLAKELLETATRVEDAVASLKGAIGGQLIINSNAAPCKYLLPPLIGVFRREHPSVRVAFRTDESGDVLAALKGHEADIGFASHRPTDKGFEVRRFCRDELVMLVPRKHRWAKLPKVSLQEIRSADVIALSDGTGTRRSLEDLLRKEGIAPSDLSIVMEVGSSEAAAMAVEAGFGVSVVSSVVAKRIGSSKVRPVQLDGAPLIRDIYMIRNRQRTPSLAQMRFCEFLRSAAVMQLLEEQTPGASAITKEKPSE